MVGAEITGIGGANDFWGAIVYAELRRSDHVEASGSSQSIRSFVTPSLFNSFTSS
jgi:hypothetical protein